MGFFVCVVLWSQEGESGPDIQENLSALNKKSPSIAYAIEGLRRKIGGDLLSHTVSRAVPSALKSLTSVFGMGTGGTSSLWPPIKTVTID